MGVFVKSLKILLLKKGNLMRLKKKKTVLDYVLFCIISIVVGIFLVILGYIIYQVLIINFYYPDW